MQRRNFLKSLIALPVVGGMVACGKGEPEAAAPGPNLEPAWLVEYDEYDQRRKTFLGMFPETESGYTRVMAEAMFDYTSRPAWTADAVLPRWTRMNLPILLEEGRTLMGWRGLDLPLEDLNKIFTP